jgi:hypothetical protein
MQIRYALLLAGLGALCVPATADEETMRAIAAIKAVGREGKGNSDAAPAWKTLVSKGSAALMPTLGAFDDGNPTAANWLRTAVEAIAEGEKAGGRKLPLVELEAFATNPRFAAAARRTAYELIVSSDPAARDRLLPGYTNDRSPELRRDAIAYELEKLVKSGRAPTRGELEKLFACTRDKDQVELLAKKLGEVGATVSIGEQFAFVTHCYLIGPFDSTAGKGFRMEYPPESAKEAAGVLEGKDGQKLSWKPADTTDEYGVFDLNKLLGKHKDAVAYALAVVFADEDTPCEVRVASPTAVQIFLNGQKLFGREEYHHGSPLDAHVGKGVLKKGRNVVVLKVCQNNQSENWAQSWQFQMRICDETGGPLPHVSQHDPHSARPVKLGAITPDKEDKK